ncbi:MAG: hybrid sensor histidine kinase/response regulator [Thermodesulfobacteriota bacterium]|nr:hybrid sensor histidine kinase/response regulator [Thermodesulfobacteriota bacterium]
MNDQERSATVMVVDDTPENLNLIRDMLQERGYRVLAFPNGRMALDAAARNPPDIILLDIMMPEMDGFEVARRLKADDALQEIPILFISALGDTEDKVKAFAAGGVDYVTKPIQFEEVHARVKAHLEMRRQRLELQAANDRLRDLESLRDSLVHMVVHDMRSPLMVILGNLEMAVDENLPEEVTELIGNSLSAGKNLLNMISSLLDVSKMEAGKMSLERSASDMLKIVGETIRLYEFRKGQRTLTMTSPEKMKALPCDAHLIQRVVRNLVDNAIKFTDPVYGAISIDIEDHEATVQVSVSDNGPGISLEYRDRVFDKFSQVEARKKSQGFSTGLGLAFCKLAVEAHGGRIGLDSDVGKGSTFWFELLR